MLELIVLRLRANSFTTHHETLTRWIFLAQVSNGILYQAIHILFIARHLLKILKTYGSKSLFIWGDYPLLRLYDHKIYSVHIL